jgi:putative transposase
VPHDIRDSVVDFVRSLATRTELPVQQILGWLDLASGKFYRWRGRYGRINRHNSWVPRDHWIVTWERKSIIEYHDAHPLDGYRRLAFMMIDEDLVAVSPSTTYRVLRAAGRLDRWNAKTSKKGTGFVQPLSPHAHWHVDIAYLNIASTFYYLCSVLDGFSRFLVHWEIRESMKEVDIETILQRAHELYPEAKPRVITDNGPQFIAGDFRKFIRLSGMTHVKTSPYYPQSNGKIERWHRTLKATTIRPQAPGSVEAARRMVGTFVDHYNHKRLHSALGFITPADKLVGREKDIWTVRDQRLEAAREKRRVERGTASANAGIDCVVQF